MAVVKYSLRKRYVLYERNEPYDIAQTARQISTNDVKLQSEEIPESHWAFRHICRVRSTCERNESRTRINSHWNWSVRWFACTMRTYRIFDIKTQIATTDWVLDFVFCHHYVESRGTLSANIQRCVCDTVLCDRRGVLHFHRAILPRTYCGNIAVLRNGLWIAIEAICKKEKKWCHQFYSSQSVSVCRLPTHWSTELGSIYFCC